MCHRIPRKWVFKPVFGRVGEDVAIAGVTEQRAYKEIIRDVSRHPVNWIAQRDSTRCHSKRAAEFSTLVSGLHVGLPRSRSLRKNRNKTIDRP